MHTFLDSLHSIKMFTKPQSKKFPVHLNLHLTFSSKALYRGLVLSTFLQKHFLGGIFPKSNLHITWEACRGKSDRDPLEVGDSGMPGGHSITPWTEAEHLASKSLWWIMVHKLGTPMHQTVFAHFMNIPSCLSESEMLGWVHIQLVSPWAILRARLTCWEQ